MKEEGNAEGYTRGNCIFIKSASYKLFVHELFHILSKHNNLISKEAYDIFDFNTNFQIIYPIEIKPYLISNPDTPLNVCTQIIYNDKIIRSVKSSVDLKLRFWASDLKFRFQIFISTIRFLD